MAKKIEFSLFLLILCFLLKGQKNLPLIPMPSNIILASGNFILSDSTILIADEKSFEANYLKEYLKKHHDINVSIAKTNTLNKSSIQLEFLKPNSSNLPTESYSVLISKNEIKITDETEDMSGVFYAIQTLIQLLPVDKKGKIQIPCLQISDKPQYPWRGMHLDVCRHFFTKEEVKKYIDYLAMYKFNVFHWHLTEDQGWRIEIKKYPKLTEMGAWRKGSMVGAYKQNKFDTLRYGGFYTQDDIKEIVSYATQRHITIVPEIEMPGHCLAALAAYPQLSCTGGPVEVARGWGVFDDVYCPKEETFKFLEDVLTEVCELFPGKYIHIGGDECLKARWKNCPNCQALIKKENLKDEHGLQSYFITRMEKYLNAKGKQIIGWDEILEGGLAPNAAVMSWRGTEGGVTAAKQKHYVVMSPGKPCYFDHYQSKNTKAEPFAIGGYNPLDSVYKYNPTPKELLPEEKKYIMGAQGNVWTEYITSFSQVEYMAIPRMCALAEVLWCKPESKNYANFIERLKQNKNTLVKQKINYAKHFLTKKK